MRRSRFKHPNNTSSVAGLWDWISMGIEEGSAVKTASVNPWQHFKEVCDIVCKTLYTCVHEKDRAGGNALNVCLNKACLSQAMLVFIGSYLNSARARGIYWDSHGRFWSPQPKSLALPFVFQSSWQWEVMLTVGRFFFHTACHKTCAV